MTTELKIKRMILQGYNHQAITAKYPVGLLIYSAIKKTLTEEQKKSAYFAYLRRNHKSNNNTNKNLELAWVEYNRRLNLLSA